MSAFVMLRAAGHRLALGADEVVRFDRGEEGELLLDEPGRADWVVELRDGQRWRTQQRPALAELSQAQPLPPMLERWAEAHGIVGCVEGGEGLVLVVSPAFSQGRAS